MYGIYGDIVGAAERALACFDETEQLLEYPEVQADKAYYLSVLSQYNRLKLLKDKLAALVNALREARAASALLAEAETEEERLSIYEEISSFKRTASESAAALAAALGCKGVAERAYCRFKLKAGTAKFGAALFALMKSDLLSHGGKIENENVVTAKGGFVQEISFFAEGADVIIRLTPLTGAHKVYLAQAGSAELCFAVTPAASAVTLSEDDCKIDVFHSSGAGGQNINKVETAVRITHLPTGLTVVCQDERSQLKNKKRALETLERRLREQSEQAEKKRIEADIRAQHSRKNTPISFDSESRTMTDTRLNAFTKVAFPLSDTQFTSYLNGLIAL